MELKCFYKDQPLVFFLKLAVFIFPNYMMHTVYPFTDSDEERRSISFNAKIDDNIYDAYG